MAKDWLKYDQETQIHFIDIFVHELKTTDEYLIDHCIEEIEDLIQSYFIPNEYYEAVIMLKKYIDRLEQVSIR